MLFLYVAGFRKPDSDLKEHRIMLLVGMSECGKVPDIQPRQPYGVWSLQHLRRIVAEELLNYLSDVCPGFG